MAGGSRAGFTLLEMMMTLAITGMAVAGVEQLMVGQLRQLSRQAATAERRQEGRAALAVLTREMSLAGFPAGPDPACHAMREGVEVEPSTIRFLANLYGVATTLEAPADIGATVLRIPDDVRIRAGEGAVSPGTAFAAHDVVYLYDPGRSGDPADDRVECHRLERAGRAGAITLTAGDAIRRPFPAGSRVQVVNEVRYAHDAVRRQLLRTVDGGAQSIADGVESVEFSRQRGRIVARIAHDPGPSGPGALGPHDQWGAEVVMRNDGTILEWME